MAGKSSDEITLTVMGHDRFQTFYPAASVGAAKAKLKKLHPDGTGYLNATIDACSVRKDGDKDSFCTPWKKYPGKNWVYVGMQ